jgi:hypothetical protein
MYHKPRHRRDFTTPKSNEKKNCKKQKKTAQSAFMGFTLSELFAHKVSSRSDEQRPELFTASRELIHQSRFNSRKLNYRRERETKKIESELE